MIKNDFGMPTLIENRTLQENVDLCKRLGLRFIELNMNFPEYQVDRLADPAPFYEAADKAGIYYTIHLDEALDVADFNPLVREAYLETVRRTILAAKAFLPLVGRYGGPSPLPFSINMHMNHGVLISLPDRKVPMYARDLDTYVSCFADFRDRAAEWIGSDPIRINIENTDGFRSYEKKAIDLLLENGCFGLTWDIGHSKAAKETDADFILSRRNRLCHMHVHDGNENPPRNHLALGAGEIDLAARLKTAEETGARCVLETKTVEALERSVLWLKNRP